MAKVDRLSNKTAEIESLFFPPKRGGTLFLYVPRFVGLWIMLKGWNLPQNPVSDLKGCLSERQVFSSHQRHRPAHLWERAASTARSRCCWPGCACCRSQNHGGPSEVVRQGLSEITYLQSKIHTLIFFFPFPVIYYQKFLICGFWT